MHREDGAIAASPVREAVVAAGDPDLPEPDCYSPQDLSPAAAHPLSSEPALDEAAVGYRVVAVSGSGCESAPSETVVVTP